MFSLQEHKITGDDLLKSYFPDVPISNVLKLEGLANRDSIPYAETYGLGPANEMRTLLRGTLRYATDLSLLIVVHANSPTQVSWLC